jgi:hypothetical protein
MTIRPPLFRSLPSAAIALGVAGLLPFLIFGVASVGADAEKSFLATQGLIAYGGVILGFLGGVHWGFTLADEDDDRPARVRLALGVLPALIGWAAILAAIVHFAPIGLAILIAGHIGTIVVEHRAAKRDLVPSGYMALRWVLAVIVAALLTTVLVLRLFGAHVLF